MSPRKLSNDDRQEILNLYRTTKETTSTLATRFGVSSSTISRFLKSNLSTLEYEDLIQEKRLARTANYQGDYNPEDYQDDNQNVDSESSQAENKPEQIEAETTSANQQQLSLSITEESPPTPSNKTDNDNQVNQELTPSADISFPSETKSDKTATEDNSAKADSEILPSEKPTAVAPNIEDTTSLQTSSSSTREDKEEVKPVIVSTKGNESKDNLANQSQVVTEDEDIFEREEEERNYLDDFDEVEDLESVNAIRAMFGEDVDDDENDDDWDDDDDDDEDDEIVIPKSSPQLVEEIRVLPLSQAVFPRKCYLAIDRSSELMTRLLKDFNELGKIPPEETKQRTLPVFDNHRVAKRFCDRKGKVIKLPNGKILEKTSTYLNAKGITRLLINGKIYSLS